MMSVEVIESHPGAIGMQTYHREELKKHLANEFTFGAESNFGWDQQRQDRHPLHPVRLKTSASNQGA